MKATLLIFFVLIGAGASAQTASLCIHHSSGADAPVIDVNDTSNHIPPGYLTLVTEDPLVVAECPSSSYINRASVVVNPARSSLTVDSTDAIPQQRITVAISYEDGKLLQSTSFLPKERAQTVSLPELKANTLYASRYNVAVYQDDKRLLYWGQFGK